MKSVASALVLVASAADFAAPVLIAPALVLAAATAARAEEVRTVRQETVIYRDLDLATPTGRATFQARLHHAAEDVCGPAPDRRAREERADFRICVKKAITAAVAALPPVEQQAAAMPAPRRGHAG